MILVAACALVAAVLAAVGAWQLATEKRRLDRRVERVLDAPLLALDPQRLARSLTRIERDAVEAQALARRTGAALADIRQGLRDLRIPQAMAALRAAGTAIRALGALL